MIRIKNWAKFQHFRNRRPPWIKLYRDLLDDPEWHELPPKHAKALVMLWLIASENCGAIPKSTRLAFRLRVGEAEVAEHLAALSGWITRDEADEKTPNDANMISPRYHDDTPERETEGETEKESCPIPQRKTRSGLPRKSKNREVKLASDSEWIAKVRETYAGTGIDIDAEMVKAKGWLLGPKGKGRAFTQSYFLNWLNRCDRVMTQKKTPAQPRPGMTPAKIAEIAAHISAGCADLDAVLARSGELGLILEEEGSKQQDIDKMRVMDAVKAMINEQKGA